MSSGTDALKLAFRDYQTEGVPATGANEPDKSEIRSGLNILSGEISGVAQSVADLENAIDAIETGSAEGIIVEASKADLDARASTLGLGTDDAGRAGRVYEDGTPSNNGDYRWDGAAWEFLGADRIGKVETTAADLTALTLGIAGARDIIVDQANRLGGGSAVYVPRQIALFANGGTAINLTLAADSKLSSHHKVPITSTASTYQVIYYDKADAVVKVTARPDIAPADPSRYFHILTLFGAGQGWASEMKVSSTVDWQATFTTGYPIAYDAGEGKLYLPQLYGLRDSGTASWNLQPLTTDENYREVAVPTSGAATFIYVDVYAAIADSRDPDALIVSQAYTNRPVKDGTAIILLGVVFNGVFTPANPDVLVANIVPNQFGGGREDNGLADLIFPGTVAADLTQSESLALGFTRGWRPTGTSAFYGGRFPQAMNSGFFFYRFYVETDTASNFGTPLAYMVERNEDGSNDYTFGAARLFKKHSANLAEYCGTMRADGEKPAYGFWCGISSAPDTGVRVFGMQGWLGATDNPWISKRDYPRMADEPGARMRALEAVSKPVADIDPLVPPVLYVHPTRAYRIYADQMFGEESRGSYRIALEAARTAYGPVSNMEIDSGALVSTDLPEGAATWHFESVVTQGTKKTAISQIVTLNPSAIDALDFKILFLGDSITDWAGAAVQPVRRLRDMGATVTPIGTMNQYNSIAGTGDTELGEGRSGRKMADFYGLTQDQMAIIPVGDEADYLALSTADKRAWNPFLKVADAGDIADRPEMIMSGNIFDMRFYLDRFSLDDPDVVVINLATNDYGSETPEVAAEHVAAGLNIIVSQARLAVPGVKIVLAYNSRGVSAASQAFWENGFRACLLEYIKFTLDDGDVTLAPGWLTINRLTGFPYTLTADPDTGISAGSVSDTTHYGPMGRAEYGEVVAQFIAGAMLS